MSGDAPDLARILEDLGRLTVRIAKLERRVASLERGQPLVPADLAEVADLLDAPAEEGP